MHGFEAPETKPVRASNGNAPLFPPWAAICLEQPRRGRAVRSVLLSLCGANPSPFLPPAQAAAIGPGRPPGRPWGGPRARPCLCRVPSWPMTILGPRCWAGAWLAWLLGALLRPFSVAVCAAPRCDGPTVRLEVTGRTTIDWTDLGGGRLVDWQDWLVPRLWWTWAIPANLSALII
jgi:hypothetical protein